ncbi:MAG: hypothetical protein GY810_00930 [Aureispira sp.]|nr:hypothetical protein [Aureispira sp.]
MARRINIKVKKGEMLDDTNVKKVKALLEQDKPITKKAACQMLNIAYNVKRLASIITAYEEKIETRKRLFASNRGKAWGDIDTRQLVMSYLKGSSISDLSASLFRSVGAIKKKLVICGVPLRKAEAGYFNPELLPDDCAKEYYDEGELVWSSRYCCVVEVGKLFQTHEHHGNVYGIWVYGKHNQSGYQPWYELGELPILKQIGLKADDFKLDLYDF